MSKLPEIGENAKLRIECNGTAHGLVIVDADTGSPVPWMHNVRDIEYRVGVNSRVSMTTITLFGLPLLEHRTGVFPQWDITPITDARKQERERCAALAEDAGNAELAASIRNAKEPDE